LIKDYYFGVERSTRIKDCHLKGCMVEQKCKNNISGRSPRKMGCGLHLLMFTPKYFWVVTIHDRTVQEKGRAIAEPAWHS
jgi:hypothetical protein